MSTMEAIKGLQVFEHPRPRPLWLPRELVALAEEIQAEGVSFTDALSRAAAELPDLLVYALNWDETVVLQ